MIYELSKSVCVTFSFYTKLDLSVGHFSLIKDFMNITSFEILPVCINTHLLKPGDTHSCHRGSQKNKKKTHFRYRKLGT